MLCAQHALNGILQGHFFDASQLAQIAEEIAEYERAELGLAQDDSMTGEMAQHMDDTGYFSVEVLDRAFKTWHMNLVRWRKQGMQDRYSHPEREFAFILNLGSHWLAVRGFGRRDRQWFNLNSFFPKPQWLGEAYLGTFLQAVRFSSLIQAEQEGYSVFVVEHDPGAGPLDNIADDMADSGTQGTEEAPISISDDDDPELQEALRLSREEYSNQAGNDAQSLVRRPLIQTPRRRRVREPSSGSEELDAHVDAIAPSRHRLRNDSTSSIIESLPASGRRSQRRSQQRTDQDTETDTPGMRPGRSRRNSRRHSSSDILDDEESPSVRQSPFLTAVATSSLLNEDVQEIEESSDSDIEEVHAPPKLDDDDEQLQAVIAASLGQPYKVSDRILSHTQREFHRPDPAPVPADVERIRRMREAAQSPTEPTPEPPAPKPAQTDDSEDESEAEQTVVSPEEMRRLRLARFG